MKEEKPHNVLMIDDDQLVLRAFSRVLRDEDYNLFTAVTVEEGIKIMRENPVSVVVADTVLPDYDGNYVLEFVKENFPKTKTIVFTGWPHDVIDWEKIRICNPFTVISKPDVDNRLRKAIRAAIKEFENRPASIFV